MAPLVTFMVFFNVLKNNLCEGMGANFTRNFTGAYSEIVDSLMNKTLIVTTIEVNGSENTAAAVCSSPKCKYLL